MYLLLKPSIGEIIIKNFSLIFPIGIAAFLLGLIYHGVSLAFPIGSYAPKEGDIVFQSFHHNPLTDLIEECTHSQISHCGVVLNESGQWVVIEAIGPVTETPLKSWVLRGRNGGFIVESMDLTPTQLEATKAKLLSYIGKPYDTKFEMSDDAIYCSELVYKGFKSGTGQELGHLQKLGDLDWRGHEAMIRRLSGDGSLPLNRLMITPVEMSQAPQLHEVYRQNW